MWVGSTVGGARGTRDARLGFGGDWAYVRSKPLTRQFTLPTSPIAGRAGPLGRGPAVDETAHTGLPEHDPDKYWTSRFEPHLRVCTRMERPGVIGPGRKPHPTRAGPSHAGLHGVSAKTRKPCDPTLH